MIKPLTSLRFFFALMVLLSHCVAIDPFFDKHIFQEGFVGVSFFFVLSGFIINYAYKQRFKERIVTKREFWVARIARIYPLHILTLLVAIIIGLASGGSIISKVVHFIFNLFLVQSFIPIPGFYYSFNAPSWSLACEQLFYFLFPFLMLWFANNKKLLLMLVFCLLAVVFGMYFTPADQTIVNTIWYVNPITRFPDFLLGMLLYNLYERYKNIDISYTKSSVYELIGVIIFFIFYLFADSFSIVFRASAYYWLPIALVIFVFAFQRGCFSKLLSNKYLVLLGEISFGVYMIHYLVIHLFKKVMFAYNLSFPYYFSFFIVIFVTLSLSLISFYYFEKPANYLVKRILSKKAK